MPYEDWLAEKKMNFLFFLVPLFIGLIQTSQGATSKTPKDDLFRHLTTNYVPSIDPPGDTTTVKISVGLVCSRYEPNTQKLISRAYERLNWKDSRLLWTPDDFSGIEKIRIPAKLLWTPDIRLYNTQDEPEERDDGVHAIVKSDGSVTWVPPATYTTYCYNPSVSPSSSSIKCEIRLGSWSYDTSAVELEANPILKGFDTLLYLNNSCPYSVYYPTAIVVHRSYPCCPGVTFPTLEIIFYVKPRSLNERSSASSSSQGSSPSSSSSPKSSSGRRHFGGTKYGRGS